MYLNDPQAVTTASILLELFALFITGLLMLSSLMTQDRHDKSSRIFYLMLSANAAALVCDLITWVWEGPHYTVLMYTANFFVFSLGYVMTALFTAYLKCFISRKLKFDKYLILLEYLLAIISVLLVVVSLFNGMYFYVQDGRLVSGPLAELSIILSLVMIFGDMVMIFAHRSELGIKNTTVFLSYGILPVIAFFIQLSGTELTITWLASTLTMLLIYLMIHIEYVRKLDRSQTELSENKVRLSQSQSALMLSQIQPHFLYNSLTVIDQLIKTDPTLAREALAEFSTYLRCNLSSLRRNELIPFSDELKHIRAYLSLEEMRFGELLHVSYNIEADDFYVPSLSIQPLVENAVNHGLSDKEDGGTVKLSVRSYNDRYEITVSDDGMGFYPGEYKHGGTHMGLENIRTRLAALGAGELKVHSQVNAGTTATVIIYKNKETQRNENFSG